MVQSLQSLLLEDTRTSSQPYCTPHLQCLTFESVPFPGAHYGLNTDPDQDKEFPPLMSETIPEGVVLTLRTAMKLKTFSVDADTNINFGGK